MTKWPPSSSTPMPPSPISSSRRSALEVKKKGKSGLGKLAHALRCFFKVYFCRQTVRRTQRGASAATFHAPIWEIQVAVVKGTLGLTNGKKNKKKKTTTTTTQQPAPSPTGCTRLVVTALPPVCFFSLSFFFLFFSISALESWKREQCFVHVYQQAYPTLGKRL